MRVFFLKRRFWYVLVPAMLICFFIFSGFLNYLCKEKRTICSCGEDEEIVLKDPPVESHQVWELQFLLEELGYYMGPLDGIFDREVQKSLKNFQEDNNMNPDGVIRSEFWEALGSNFQTPVAAGTTEEPKGEVSIVVNTYSRTLTVYVDGQIFKTFPVAIGKKESKTPVGEWAIIRKSAGWGGGFGTRWMELNVPWGTYGIHGTNKPYSIGRAASAGCIRMFNRDVEQLYRWVKVGTRVKVIGQPINAKIIHTLRPGHTGKDVLTFQRELKKWGFNPGYTDGRFGSDTEKAVRRMEVLYGFKVDGEAEKELAYLLGLE